MGVVAIAPMGDVTAHFARAEFDQRAHLGEPHLAYPDEWVAERLRPLCEDLETLRAYCGGRRVQILSGLRSARLNVLVGGQMRSQHLVGRAADLVIDGLTPNAVQDAVEHLLTVGALPHIRGVGIYRTFTHLDVRLTDQVVRWFGQRTTT